MEENRNQMVIVMDEHGGTAGILTIEDICAEAIGDIEEGLDDVPDVLPVRAWALSGTGLGSSGHDRRTSRKGAG